MKHYVEQKHRGHEGADVSVAPESKTLSGNCCKRLITKADKLMTKVDTAPCHSGKQKVRFGVCKVERNQSSLQLSSSVNTPPLNDKDPDRSEVTFDTLSLKAKQRLERPLTPQKATKVAFFTKKPLLSEIWGCSQHKRMRKKKEERV